jgi:hypothetical protein
MTEVEVEKRRRELIREYYEFLAVAAVHSRDRSFGSYHAGRLKELGYPLDRLRLGKAISLKLIDLLLNPKRTVEILLKRARIPQI